MIPNFWYAVAESVEVKEGELATFKRLNMELVFWRDKQGKIVVMRDLCPHRQSKLSPGKLVDGNIQCHFHGFQYDREGACQLIPANGRNGPKPKIFQCWNFPAQEAYGIIWMWYGEPRKEYPPVPFFEGLEDHIYSSISRLWNVHYSRAIENQLDVSHIPFVHAKTIGKNGGTLVNGPYTTLENNTIQVWVTNQPDAGLPAMKPSQVPPPDRPSTLRFKFPNVWQNRISDKLSIVALFVPIDEEHTQMYVRFYHNLVKQPLMRRFIAFTAKRQNSQILAEDQAIVETQSPKKADLEVGERFIPGDRPIALYLQRRRDLMNAAFNKETLKAENHALESVDRELEESELELA